MKDNWFEIANIETVDSPSVALYLEHLKSNIDEMTALVHGKTNRLMPHVKTNKMPEVLKASISIRDFQF